MPLIEPEITALSERRPRQASADTDFPEPLSPTIANVSPSFILNVNLRTAMVSNHFF